MQQKRMQQLKTHLAEGREGETMDLYAILHVYNLNLDTDLAPEPGQSVIA